MADWLVLRPTIIGQVDAPDRSTAEQLARRRFGDDVAVQSAVSHRITQQERETAARQRRIREDDGA